MRNENDQLYFQMLVFTLLLTAVGSVFLVQMTWSWGGEWDKFLKNNAPPFDAPLEMLAFFQSYYLYLESNGLWMMFLVHLLLPLCAMLGVSLYFSIKILYAEGGLDKATHVSGGQLLQEKRAVADGCDDLKKELSNDESGAGVFLHPNIQITKRRELGNIFVFGQQGSGKSVVIKPLLKRIIDRDDHAIIYDEKREYTSLFLDEKTCLLSPTDARGVAWNPSLDVVNEDSAKLLAECLVNAKDDFWVRGARLVVTGCLICLLNRAKPWGWSHLRKIISLEEKELLNLFHKYCPSIAKLVVEGSKTTQGFAMIIETQLNWIDVLAKAWPESHKSEFSISAFVREESGYKRIIIPNDPLYSSISDPLCNAIIALSVQHLLALPDSDSRRLWYVLDELGNLKKNNSILKLLTLGRSKGSRVIAGVQSISQLNKIYGRENAETMLSLFSNLVCLRLGAAGESAKKASDIFGERVVELPADSIDNKGNRSTTFSEAKEKVVSVNQITQLPQSDGKSVSGFLLVSGWKNVYSLSWPISDIPKIADDYVSASWLLNSKKLKINKKENKHERGSRGRRRDVNAK